MKLYKHYIIFGIKPISSTFAKKNKLMTVLTFMFSCLLLGCSSSNASETNTPKLPTNATPVKIGHLYIPNNQVFEGIKGVLNSSNSKRTHFIQLGDSHTAADVFTGEIRQLLQREFGNGGIGFIQPTEVTGIRSNLVTISSEQGKFSLLSSRSDQSPIFPLGGYLLDTKGNSGSIKLSPRKTVSSDNALQARALYFTNSAASMSINGNSLNLPPTNNLWKWSDAVKNVHLPVTITFSKNRSLKIGGYYLENMSDKGIVFSALGINGAQINYWDRWHHSWKQSLKTLTPDVMLIAYGTNEAFGNNLDISAYASDLNNRMRTLKSTYPNTLFIVIGPPDSQKINKKNSQTCNQSYSDQLARVIEIQKDSALKNGFAFWNWQESMGGSCSITRWLAQDMAKPDLVHLTTSGYTQSANQFVKDLKRVLN
ncbi:GDSL-type esterase/lipase family protein [Thorsellia kenyensis]|uniref:GDSL-type esterase/lipase family protein n=1 Tax=Thorsellia kenyensis TaxID=1549888 RepID=A0ABV6CAF5_9GAMM